METDKDMRRKAMTEQVVYQPHRLTPDPHVIAKNQGQNVIGDLWGLDDPIDVFQEAARLVAAQLRDQTEEL